MLNFLKQQRFFKNRGGVRMFSTHMEYENYTSTSQNYDSLR